MIYYTEGILHLLLRAYCQDDFIYERRAFIFAILQYFVC